MIDQRLNLYKHNLEGYGKVRNAYETGEDIVGIVHATGTGKTLIFLQLCLDNPDKKTLFVAPSNAIIEHVLEVIEECGLSKEKDFPNLEFCTYQSLTTKSDEELASLDIDLFVLDEFHHIGAPVWGEKIDTIVNTHKNMKIFGMTAYTVRDRGTIYERDMALPDGDELFSDKIVSRYDLVDAMCDGVLPIPNYKSAYLLLMEDALELEQEILNSKKMSQEDKNEYLRIIRDCKKQIDKAPTAKDLIKQNLQQGDKCIYFCPLGDGVILKDDEILGTNDVSSIRRRIGNLALEVSNSTILYETTSDIGESGKLNRDHFYNDTSFFRNEDVSDILRIMFAKNQYNEGVHAPGVTKVFLSRPTNSDIVFFEQIGRVLSTKGNIIELTKIYENKTIEELREIANKQGINIALCESKEEIMERLLAPTIIDLVGNISFIKQLKDNLQRRIKERQERGIPTKITQKLVEASFDIEVENENLYEILQAIQTNVGNLTWDDWYELATQYHNDNGHLLISAKYKTLKGENLGKWIINQRTAYKNKKLTSEQITKLENIGMIWKVGKIKDEQLTWEEWYELAQEYYDQNGHLNIEQKYITETGEKLGNWISDQRKKYKENKLSPYKVSKLENIGMVWTLILSWDKWYELAEAYYKEKGHLLIARGESFEGKSLGIWIINQRVFHKNGKLTQEQITKLETIGMVWQVQKTKDEQMSWEEWYELARLYYEKNKSLNVPYRYVTETGEKLGKWIGIHRILYRKNKLTTEQIIKLEDIGMQWQVLLTWEDRYELAKEYYEQNGNLNIAYNYVTETGENLGNWIIEQRQAYRNDKLNDDKVNKLESIGMIWKVLDEQWNKMYQQAKSYYEQNGHLNVPYRYVTETGAKLGIWIITQRTAYKNKKLTSEQINKLETIGMQWKIRETVTDRITWEDWYEQAKAYYEEKGHLNITRSYVTETGAKLGIWISTQRKAYKNNKLTSEQINKLEAIGMQWQVGKTKDEQLTWEEGYELAKSYYEQKGHLNVPDKYKAVTGEKLGRWIGRQRALCKNNELSPDKVSKLEAIGMVWDIRSNNSDIELLCNEYSINYGLNKKYVGKLSFSIFKAILMYLIDNSINYIDGNGMLISDFYMSSKDFENKYGISYQELISKEKRL